MSKSVRQEKIIELVRNNPIETQEELAALLNEAGFKATQATVSRDIKDLHLIKRNSGERSTYIYPDDKVMDQNKYLRVFSEGYVKAEKAGTIVVIKTVSGMAMAVAASLDSLGLDEIVGTIAGDDTIMCATKSEDDAQNMINKIRMMLA